MVTAVVLFLMLVLVLDAFEAVSLAISGAGRDGAADSDFDVRRQPSA